MNKKLFGNIFNFILLGGYGVFCWYFSYLSPGYGENSVFLEILKYTGIFIAARMFTAILHQAGHLLFAAYQGLGVMYFEACFFKFWHDGERVRFGLFFDPRLFFSGTVIIKLKGAFDTAAGFKKNSAKYSRFLLGGLIFNLAAVVAVIAIYVLCLSFGQVFSPLFLCSLAVLISCWFMIYNAFDEAPGRRGDFISFTKSRDAESLVVTLAAQSVVEDIDHTFLFTEAQRVIAFKIQNGLPWMDRYSMNTLAGIALYACAEKAAFDPEIEEYLDGEFFNAEKSEAAEYTQKLFLVLKIHNFAAYYILNYGRGRAEEVVSLSAKTFETLRLRDNALLIYFTDTREMLKENLDADGLDTLSYTKFLPTDTYTAGFKGYRELCELAEDNVHQAIYSWQDIE